MIKVNKELLTYVSDILLPRKYVTKKKQETGSVCLV